MLCLTAPSDPAWAAAALRDLDAVLIDHAHCEMKAAANALSLAARHPSNPRLVHALTDLAREEIDHFQRVLRVVERRGLTLPPPRVDEYAVELRRAAGRLRPRLNVPLVDRLLVGALIEARSCERFKLLVEALTAPEHAELRAFYADLLAAEARHYRTFIGLAIEAAEGELDEPSASVRLAALSRLEGEIVVRLAARDARASVHG